jgi:hypothetical protein
VRRKAKQQAATEREHARRSRAARAKAAARRPSSRPARDTNAATLDQRDASVPWSRAGLLSNNDDTAARVVAAGWRR